MIFPLLITAADARITIRMQIVPARHLGGWNIAFLSTEMKRNMSLNRTLHASH